MLLRDGLLVELAELREINAVGDAMQLAALGLGLNELASDIYALNRDHLRRGYLSVELGYRRARMLTELLGFAKENLSASDYHNLYMCF